MKDGLIKVVGFAHDLKVGDAYANARAICAGIDTYAKQGAKVLVTPELGLCGRTAGDLLYQDRLLAACREALAQIVAASAEVDALVAVGLPLAIDHKLYDCAAVLKSGVLLGVVAKRYLSRQDARYFSPAPDEVQVIDVGGQEVPFGGWQVFAADNVANLAVGIEIGDEMDALFAPHSVLAAGGATLVCNLSATETLPLSATATAQRIQALSYQAKMAYLYVNAQDESTTDAVYGGQIVVAQNGDLTAKTQPFGARWLAATIDVDDLAYQRRRSPLPTAYEAVCVVNFGYNHLEQTELGSVDPYPYAPKDEAQFARFAQETFAIQAHGLATRMRRVGTKCVVLGVSGGLDSTMALLVCREACRLLGLDPKEGIRCITMPCFGTTDRTKNNALALTEAMGLSCREINISEAVARHLQDIGHSLDDHDVAFENAQARMRTMVLMDVANKEGGLVVGTGDLSELALGWCTYNGDHMSMYAVNATLTKTLMRRIIAYFAAQDAAIGKVLCDVLDTPVSPELLPGKEGRIVQKTEEIVGKYDVNDFILYYAVGHGFAPDKIFRLAVAAFPSLDKAQLKADFERFYRRFFGQQFKRSCSPDGAKAGAIDLSPRGEWQMPSDATAAIWLKTIETL